jgi:hypothetical protein
MIIFNFDTSFVNIDFAKNNYQGPDGDLIKVSNLINSQPPKYTIAKATDDGINSNFSIDDIVRQKASERISGRIIYPPGGYMGWHTNGDAEGRRIYCSWSENGDSGMLWFLDGKTVVDQDLPGWNIRTFVCPTWHAVYSRCWRVSIGFHLGVKQIV